MRSEPVPRRGDDIAEALPARVKAPGRRRRRLGTALIVLGLAAVAYGAVIWLWRDPVTDLYARWQQHRLAGQLVQSFEEYRVAAGLPASGPIVPEGASVADMQGTTRDAAQKLLDSLEEGKALGRLVIPRLDIHPVVINGTRWAQDLSRGPGRYPETSLPGLDRVTAIAGHRTTFGAPFRNIDDLAPGDKITLVLPYGTFHYRVFGHEIVESDDWSIIRNRGFDTLVLSACHPLYSASHRWIVFARLAEVELPGGASYTLPESQEAASSAAVAS